jgi:hypothetical protein
MPRSLEEGVLYVSEKFRTASHLCACGCGTKIVTPLRETEYSLRVRGSAVSLDPSIGNWDHPCQSHYLIKDNRVVWAKKMSRAEIDFDRARDDMSRDEYFERRAWPWWRRAVYALKRLFS